MTDARTSEFMAHPEVVAFVAEHPTLEPILRRAFRFGYALAQADAVGLDEVPVGEYLKATVKDVKSEVVS